jgi:uncharacterized protein YjbJ (UPF0337 family)
MTESGKAEQARKGLIGSIKGRAKEILGALTGNDSLTAEGELARTQAEKREGIRPAGQEVVDALDDHQDAVGESALARAEADRIRRQADSLSKDADRP